MSSGAVNISISGSASAFDAQEFEITDALELEKLSGLRSEDSCLGGLSDELIEIGIDGGFVRIEFDPNRKCLRVVTEYVALRKLLKKELDLLVADTTAQWSDGIGEGCFDEFSERAGITISIDGKDVAVTQVQKPVAKRPKTFSKLFSAIKQGNLTLLKSLLSKGEDINSRNRWGQTPLIAAIYSGQTELAKTLIRQGADLGVGPGTGTALSAAAMMGDETLVTALLEAGANPNVCDPAVKSDGSSGYAPLMWAANRGHVGALRLLLDAGANANIQCTLGWTAIMTAQSFEVIELLLDRGADPNIKNNEGRNSIEEALWQAEAFRESGDTESEKEWESKAELLKNRVG